MAAEIAPYESLDGFGEIKVDDSGKRFRSATPKRVRLDADSNCAYNLHGSVFFDERAFPHPEQPESDFRVLEWICTPGSVNPVCGSNSNRQPSTTGERRLWSNIVTGLSKPERILLEPQRAFYHRFAMDCATADTFIVVGYSFSDPHVNSLIEERVVQGDANLWYVGYDEDFARRHRDAEERGETRGCRLRHYKESSGVWLSDGFPQPFPSEYDSHVTLHNRWGISSEETYALYADGFDSFLRGHAWKHLL